MNVIIKKIEEVFVVFSLLLFSRAVIILLRREGGGGGDVMHGDPFQQIMWAIIYIITFIFVIYNKNKIIRSLNENLLLVFLILIAVLSVFWSDIPSITFRRSIALIGTSLFGLYFGARFNIYEQVRLLKICMGILIILSFIFILILPQYGIMSGTHEGAWRGVFPHKNYLGRISVLSSIIFLLSSRIKYTYKNLSFLFFILSIILLVMSESIGSILIFLALMYLISLLILIKENVHLFIALAIFFLLVALIIGFLSISNIDFILNMVEKDETLTGRTTLWILSLNMIKQSPILGYGYNGFWTGWEGQSAIIWSIVNWEVPHAHNGFIDLLLDLGIVGLFIFMAGFILILFYSMKNYLYNRYYILLIPLIYLIFFLLTNINESVILSQNNIFWVLYISVYACSRHIYFNHKYSNR